jgi:hypothetical protein
MDEDVSREVDQLLKDREKFESWLERLEQQRSETSEQAYERVHRDYQQRLEEVIGRLQSHGESIKGKLGELQHQVSELDAERAGKAEELDEARLRHMVGEYGDDTDWRDLEGQLLTSLQETEGRIGSVRGEIERLEEIIALVERTEEKPAVEPEPAEPPSPPEPQPVPEIPPVPEPVVEAESGPVTSTLPPEVIEVEVAEPVRVDIPPEPTAFEPPLEQVVPEPVVEPPAEPVIEPPPEPIVDTLPEPVAEPEPFAEPPADVEPPPPVVEPPPPVVEPPPPVVEPAPPVVEPAPPVVEPPPPVVEPPPPVVEPAPPVVEPPPPQPEPIFEAPAEPEVAGVDAVASTDEGYLSLGELVLEDKDLGDILSEPPPVEAVPEEPAEPAPAPQPEAEGGEAAVGDELAFLESLSLGSDDESEGFSLFEQRGSGTPQTIICPHCSAANDPAEWYCTECGEELPAE